MAKKEDGTSKKRYWLSLYKFKRNKDGSIEMGFERAEEIVAYLRTMADEIEQNIPLLARPIAKGVIDEGEKLESGKKRWCVVDEWYEE